MKKMPSRDTTGRCRGECRNRVREGEVARQAEIDTAVKKYTVPAKRSAS